MRTHTFVRLTAALLLTLVFATRFLTPALAAAPANDDMTNAIELGYPDSAVSSTLEATAGPDDASGCGSGGSVWYRFTGSGAAVQVNTFGSDFDTVLTVFGGSPGALWQINCNDDSAGTYQSAVDFFAESGATYYFMVNGCCDWSGNVVISVVEPPPPPTPFEFEFEIDSSTVKAKTGLVMLGGTLTCSAAGSVDVYLATVQRAGRTLIRSDVWMNLSCDGSGPTFWSLQFTGSNGIFKGGHATISGSASGYGLEYGSGYWYTDIGPTEVRLRNAR